MPARAAGDGDADDLGLLADELAQGGRGRPAGVNVRRGRLLVSGAPVGAGWRQAERIGLAYPGGVGRFCYPVARGRPGGDQEGRARDRSGRGPGGLVLQDGHDR